MRLRLRRLPGVPTAGGVDAGGCCRVRGHWAGHGHAHVHVHARSVRTGRHPENRGRDCRCSHGEGGTENTDQPRDLRCWDTSVTPRGGHSTPHSPTPIPTWLRRWPKRSSSPPSTLLPAGCSLPAAKSKTRAGLARTATRGRSDHPTILRSHCRRVIRYDEYGRRHRRKPAAARRFRDPARFRGSPAPSANEAGQGALRSRRRHTAYH